MKTNQTTKPNSVEAREEREWLTATSFHTIVRPGELILPDDPNSAHQALAERGLLREGHYIITLFFYT